MAETDDVQLPDLQVIQRYSLAVRGATAPREDVIAALQADLDWLSGTGRRRTPPKAAAAQAPRTPAAPVKAAPVKGSVTKAPARKASPVPAKRAAPTATRAPAKPPAKRSAPSAKRAPVKSAAKKSPARRK